MLSGALRTHIFHFLIQILSCFFFVCMISMRNQSRFSSFGRGHLSYQRYFYWTDKILPGFFSHLTDIINMPTHFVWFKFWKHLDLPILSSKLVPRRRFLVSPCSLKKPVLSSTPPWRSAETNYQKLTRAIGCMRAAAGVQEYITIMYNSFATLWTVS